MVILRGNDVIKCIEAMAGRHSPYEIFSDWVACMAIGISNSTEFFHDEVWKQREDHYISLMNKYNPNEQMKLCEMTAWLVESLEDEICDVLGDVFMKAGIGSSSAGQFFTPFNISELCARTVLTPYLNGYGGEVIELNEPSSGGGGMIIAAARVLKESGINYQKALKVVAQDLDWKGVYMSYVQFSLLGINAICVCGDTLREPYDISKTPKDRIMVTPAAKGMLVCGGN